VSLAGKRGGENRVFPNLVATVDLGEAEQQLAARLALGEVQAIKRARELGIEEYQRRGCRRYNNDCKS